MTQAPYIRNGSTQQQPRRHEVLYLDERAGAWWTGIPTRCDACHGQLYINPPTSSGRGWLSCLLCGRGPDVDVVETRRVVVTTGDSCLDCGMARQIRGRLARSWRSDLCPGCWEHRRSALGGAR